MFGLMLKGEALPRHTADKLRTRTLREAGENTSPWAIPAAPSRRLIEFARRVRVDSLHGSREYSGQAQKWDANKEEKKALPPRVKRMDRSARLQSARSWLKTYNGRNIASGYRKHFGVDWVCAFKELEMLGVTVDSGYKRELLKAVEGHTAARERSKTRRQQTYEEPFDQDENFAYIAGYTETGFAYGVTWEECERLNQEDLINPDGDTNTTGNSEPQQFLY